MTNIHTIPVGRIFLDFENPRHEPYKSQAEVIEYLCRDEYVYQLAKDIATHGLNPLELFALISLDRKQTEASYVVAEGNRRMCAIMLLNDPDLAPKKLRKDFKSLAEKSAKITEVLAVVFDDKNQVHTWLDRIHGGLQGGIGRKAWNPEQKTRHIGNTKNMLAQNLLDYAEENQLISPEDRKGKLTTVQRYLDNASLRKALGLNNDLGNITRTRPQNDFDLLLKKFLTDLRSGIVNSRSNADDIKMYSHELGNTQGLTGECIENETLLAGPKANNIRHKIKQSPRKPEKPKYVLYEREIHKKLINIPSFKLEKIYYSICKISLEDHTPLICVGIWSFFECLTAKIGRSDTIDFSSFLSKQKLKSLGVGDNKTYPICQAIKRISDYGNTTKHHENSANFNGEQLANDMDTLKELICKLSEEAKNSSS